MERNDDSTITGRCRKLGEDVAVDCIETDGVLQVIIHEGGPSRRKPDAIDALRRGLRRAPKRAH